MEIKLTLLDWLKMCNKEARLSITTPGGNIYEGKKSTGLSFEIEWVGFDFGNLKIY